MLYEKYEINRHNYFYYPQGTNMYVRYFNQEKGLDFNTLMFLVSIMIISLNKHSNQKNEQDIL